MANANVRPSNSYSQLWVDIYSCHIDTENPHNNSFSHPELIRDYVLEVMNDVYKTNVLCPNKVLSQSHSAPEAL